MRPCIVRVSATEGCARTRAGNIASWKKKAGDEVAAGDSLAEIETDKARAHAAPTHTHLWDEVVGEGAPERHEQPCRRSQ